MLKLHDLVPLTKISLNHCKSHCLKRHLTFTVFLSKSCTCTSLYLSYWHSKTRYSLLVWQFIGDVPRVWSNNHRNVNSISFIFRCEMSTELITTPVEEVMVNTRSRAQEFLLVPQSLTQNGDTSYIYMLFRRLHQGQ